MQTQTTGNAASALPEETFMFFDLNGRMLAMGKKSEVIEFGSQYIKTFMYYYENIKKKLSTGVDKEKSGW